MSWWELLSSRNWCLEELMSWYVMSHYLGAICHHNQAWQETQPGCVSHVEDKGQTLLCRCFSLSHALQVPQMLTQLIQWKLYPSQTSWHHYVFPQYHAAQSFHIKYAAWDNNDDDFQTFFVRAECSFGEGGGRFGSGGKKVKLKT